MAMISGYAGPRRSFTDRAIAAAKLDATAYEEVEADETAMGQAAGLVLISAAAQAIGASSEGMLGIILAPIGALFGWVIWAGVTYLIGAKVFNGTASWGELLRTLGFAQAPGILYVIGIVPLLGWLVSSVVAIWILIAGIIAIRQALDISTGKAVGVAILGWLALIIPTLILKAMF
jgi:hypothetical protein